MDLPKVCNNIIDTGTFVDVKLSIVCQERWSEKTMVNASKESSIEKLLNFWNEFLFITCAHM